MKRTVLKVKLSLFILALPLFSCAKEASPDTAEIPFTLYGGRMLLYATVYGRSGLYVFDTGATVSHLDIDPKGLLPARLVWFSGNGKRKREWTRGLNTISFGDVELRTRSEVITPSSIAVNLKKNLVMTDVWESACLKGTGARFHSQKAKSFCTRKSRIISPAIPP